MQRTKYNPQKRYTKSTYWNGIGRKNHPITEELIKANLEDTQNLREGLNKTLYVLRFTTHTEMKKTPLEQHFGRKPRTKLSNLKNAISVDSKELSVYITRNSTGEITDHLVMSKKKNIDPEYRREMTFTQNKKPSNTVSNGKNYNYPFTFYEKAHTKSSLGSKFENKPQTAIIGTKHTITTDKNKTIHRKLISNPIPFQNTTTPTKRINTRQSTEQPSCSKTNEDGTITCNYRRKEPPRLENTENSSDWLRRKEQPRNQKGQFTSPEKSTGKPMNLDLSIVSDDEFQCYNTSEGKPVHTNLDDELQLLPKQTNLTPETGIKTKDTTNEQNQSVRKSKRIPHAKQTEKLGGIPYQTNNNKKKTNKHCVLQENPTTPPDQTQTNSEEEKDDRKIRTITKRLQNNRIIRTLNSKQPYKSDFIRRGGNGNTEIKLLDYITVTLDRELFRSLFINKL